MIEKMLYTILQIEQKEYTEEINICPDKETNAFPACKFLGTN